MCRLCNLPEYANRSLAILRERFEARPFRVSEAVEAGVTRMTVQRLRQLGVLEAAGRGIVRMAGSGMGMLSDLALLSTRLPAGTICLNSALAYWHLTDEIPGRVHIALPRGHWHLPVIKEPLAKIHVFDARTFGIERLQVLSDVGEPFWVYSTERSIVDAFRLSRWIGQDLALHALREYMSRQGARPAHLAELSRQLRGGPRLRAALEALLS